MKALVNHRGSAIPGFLVILPLTVFAVIGLSSRLAALNNQLIIENVKYEVERMEGYMRALASDEDRCSQFLYGNKEKPRSERRVSTVGQTQSQTNNSGSEELVKTNKDIKSINDIAELAGLKFLSAEQKLGRVEGPSQRPLFLYNFYVDSGARNYSKVKVVLPLYVWGNGKCIVTRINDKGQTPEDEACNYIKADGQYIYDPSRRTCIRVGNSSV